MVGFVQSSTPKNKTVSVLKLERSPSHSWWWDSHNSPKHSKWLESNLQDLDDKVKEMLRLIEEDADSFAQRAEMYYQKRPELINLVEEFYRAYRSLAERYDHLRGEIRQNIPRALQVQYGLSCDSPNRTDANVGRHHCSPLRQSGHRFDNSLKKVCQIDDPPKDLDQTGDHKPINIDENLKEHDYNDALVESSSNSSDKEESSLSSSDSEVDNLTPLEQLRVEMKELEEKNNLLVESQKQAHETNTFLQSKMRDLEKGHMVKEEEIKDMQKKILELNAELAHLSGFTGQQHNELHANEAHADKNLPEKELYTATLLCLVGPADDEQSKSCKNMFGQDSCPLKLESMHGHREALFSSLLDELGALKEKNRMQQLVILERGEEKREAIRQLSVSLEMLKNENQRLEEALSLLRKRLHARGAAAALGGFSHTQFTAWKQLFALMGFKSQAPFVAVAL